jgi:hypothetical protein
MYYLPFLLFAPLWFLLPSLSSHGTIILQVPTREGILFCADKRRYNKIQGLSDDETKIFELSSKSGFAIAGARAILSEKDLSTLYDPTVVIRNYFADKDPNNLDAYWDDLQKTLLHSYNNYRLRGGPEFDTSMALPNHAIYTLLFFYVNQHNVVHVAKVEFRYKKETDGFLQTEKVDYTEEELKRAHVLATDLTKVISGTNQRFGDNRNSALVRRFRAGEDPRNISVEDGLGFSKLMIRVAHDRHSIMNSSRLQLVGPTCDCVLVNDRNGIKWLERNTDVRRDK